MYEQNREADASAHSETAKKLRRLAGGLRYDLCRRSQLLALADGFERLAGRLRKRLTPNAGEMSGRRLGAR